MKIKKGGRKKEKEWWELEQLTLSFGKRKLLEQQKSQMNLFGSIKKKSSQPDISPPLYVQKPFVETFVVSGNLRKIVKQPRYIDPNEWLATNSKKLVQAVNRGLFQSTSFISSFHSSFHSFIHSFIHSLLAFDFFSFISSFYGTISDFCSPPTCSSLLGPG